MNRVLVIGGIAALLISACKQEGAPSAKAAPQATPKAAPPATPPKPAPAKATPSAERAEATTIYQQRCVTCHGAEGKGDGPAAAALTPKPRSFTDGAWQKTISDQHINAIIVKGGMGVGKSPLMPPNPDLAAKPQVVAELVKIVRSYAK